MDAGRSDPNGKRLRPQELIEGAAHYVEQRFAGYRFAEVLRHVLIWLDETLA